MPHVRPQLAALVLVASGVLAQPAAAQEYVVKGWSETRSVSIADAEQALALQRSTVCGRAVQPTARLRVPSARDARSSGRRLLERKLKKKLRGFERKQGKNATDATAFGILSLTKGDPGGATAGFVRALEKAPSQALALVNASVLMTRVGQPAQGVSLARAAQKAKKPQRPPMGMSVRALALNAEGFALFHLRRYVEAVTVLSRAVAADPLLVEAKRNLAGAMLCSGSPSAAAQMLLDGQRRNEYTEGGGFGQPRLAAASLAEVVTDTGARRARPEAVLDMSQALDGRLPTLKLPQNPSIGAASAGLFRQLTEQRMNDHRVALDEANRLSASRINTLLTPGGTRTVAVLAYYTDWAIFIPEARAIFFDELPAYHRRMGEAGLEFTRRYVEISDSCATANPNNTTAETNCRRAQCRSALTSAHAAWLRDLEAADTAARRLVGLLHRYGTALAANLADQNAHDELIALMRQQLYQFYATYVLDTARSWTEMEAGSPIKQDCVDAPAEAEAETDPENFGPGFACPPALKLTSFDIKLPVPGYGTLKLSLKCESVTVGVDGPGISAKPFGEISYKFASGETTIYAGGKAGGPDAVNLGVKGGSYITFDRSGRIVDIGIKGTLSGGGSAGPISVGGPIFKGEFSLAPYVL